MKVTMTLGLLLSLFVSAPAAFAQRARATALSFASPMTHRAEAPASISVGASRLPHDFPIAPPSDGIRLRSNLPLLGAVIGGVILGGLGWRECARIGCTTPLSVPSAVAVGAGGGALVGYIVARLRTPTPPVDSVAIHTPPAR